MPLYRYECSACLREFSSLRLRDLCPSCGEKAVRAPVGPGSQKMERLDHGLMPRAVERLADAEALGREHVLAGRARQAEAKK